MVWQKRQKHRENRDRVASTVDAKMQSIGSDDSNGVASNISTSTTINVDAHPCADQMWKLLQGDDVAQIKQQQQQRNQQEWTQPHSIFVDYDDTMKGNSSGSSKTTAGRRGLTLDTPHVEWDIILQRGCQWTHLEDAVQKHTCIVFGIVSICTTSQFSDGHSSSHFGQFRMNKCILSISDKVLLAQHRQLGDDLNDDAEFQSFRRFLRALFQTSSRAVEISHRVHPLLLILGPIQQGRGEEACATCVLDRVTATASMDIPTFRWALEHAQCLHLTKFCALHRICREMLQNVSDLNPVTAEVSIEEGDAPSHVDIFALLQRITSLQQLRYRKIGMRTIHPGRMEALMSAICQNPSINTVTLDGVCGAWLPRLHQLIRCEHITHIGFYLTYRAGHAASDIDEAHSNTRQLCDIIRQEEHLRQLKMCPSHLQPSDLYADHVVPLLRARQIRHSMQVLASRTDVDAAAGFQYLLSQCCCRSKLDVVFELLRQSGIPLGLMRTHQA